MKKVLFILFVLPLLSFGQLHESLPGIWKGDRSDYYVMIVYNKVDGFQFSNISFIEGDLLKEKVIEEKEDYLITSLWNPDNGYNAKIKYSVVNENQILCEFEGGSTNKTTYRRVDLFDNGKLVFLETNN
tara:strand:+ start:132 stop:518 length:387 start_codon:yes stop_codon:yes gene_type:complete